MFHSTKFLRISLIAAVLLINAFVIFLLAEALIQAKVHRESEARKTITW